MVAIISDLLVPIGATKPGRLSADCWPDWFQMQVATGSERAGRLAAVLLTLLGTARLNGLEPMAWLKDVLEKLPTWPNSRIDEFLPLRPPVS